jgi:hypothetical protein
MPHTLEIGPDRDPSEASESQVAGIRRDAGALAGRRGVFDEVDALFGLLGALATLVALRFAHAPEPDK